MENPEAGNIIEGTGGAIKLRYALPGGGKAAEQELFTLTL